ncbi:MAG: WD40 repeat domain-containing protein [Planctomycetaceae bacterium]
MTGTRKLLAFCPSILAMVLAFSSGSCSQPSEPGEQAVYAEAEQAFDVAIDASGESAGENEGDLAEALEGALRSIDKLKLRLEVPNFDSRSFKDGSVQLAHKQSFGDNRFAQWSAPASMCFSPNGVKLAICERGTGRITIWNTENSGLIRVGRAHWDEVVGVAFLANDSLVSAGDDAIFFWTSDGRIQDAIYLPESDDEESASIVNFAVSHDRKVLVVSDQFGRVFLWTEAGGFNYLSSLSALDIQGDLALSPQGDAVLSGNQIIVVDSDDEVFGSDEEATATFCSKYNGAVSEADKSLVKQGLLYFLEDYRPQIEKISLSPSGRRILVDCADWMSGARYRLFDIGDIKSLGNVEGNLKSWDLPHVQLTPRRREHYGTFAISQDESRVALGTTLSDTVIRNVADGAVVFEREAFKSNTIDFSSDGSELVLGGADGIVRVLDTDSGKVLDAFRSATARNGISQIAYSPTDRLVAWNENPTIYLYDLNRKSLHQMVSSTYGANWDRDLGQSVLKPGARGSDSEKVSFSPDGKTVLVAGYQRLLGWDVEQALLSDCREEIRQKSAFSFEYDAEQGYSRAAFLPDGKSLAVFDHLANQFFIKIPGQRMPRRILLKNARHPMTLTAIGDNQIFGANREGQIGGWTIDGPDTNEPDNMALIPRSETEIYRIDSLHYLASEKLVVATTPESLVVFFNSKLDIVAAFQLGPPATASILGMAWNAQTKSLAVSDNAGMVHLYAVKQTD